jgi:hypothetical protein
MLPTTFDSVAAGTAAADNVKAITVTNKGDAALRITQVGLATSNNATSPFLIRQDETPGDFSVVSNRAVRASSTSASSRRARTSTR